MDQLYKKDYIDAGKIMRPLMNTSSKDNTIADKHIAQRSWDYWWTHLPKIMRPLNKKWWTHHPKIIWSLTNTSPKGHFNICQRSFFLIFFPFCSHPFMTHEWLKSACKVIKVYFSRAVWSLSTSFSSVFSNGHPYSQWKHPPYFELCWAVLKLNQIKAHWLNSVSIPVTHTASTDTFSPFYRSCSHSHLKFYFKQDCDLLSRVATDKKCFYILVSVSNPSKVTKTGHSLVAHTRTCKIGHACTRYAFIHSDT